MPCFRTVLRTVRLPTPRDRQSRGLNRCGCVSSDRIARPVFGTPQDVALCVALPIGSPESDSCAGERRDANEIERLQRQNAARGGRT